mmetsp:Transcript_9577/g.30360  ORF Transcript_9577/g.30360 Transcript_9577/m.30360 type:complete len:201 (-) Transcript_9577:398-1000(-)
MASVRCRGRVSRHPSRRAEHRVARTRLYHSSSPGHSHSKWSHSPQTPHDQPRTRFVGQPSRRHRHVCRRHCPPRPSLVHPRCRSPYHPRGTRRQCTRCPTPNVDHPSRRLRHLHRQRVPGPRGHGRLPHRGDHRRDHPHPCRLHRRRWRYPRHRLPRTPPAIQSPADPSYSRTDACRCANAAVATHRSRSRRISAHARRR